MWSTSPLQPKPSSRGSEVPQSRSLWKACTTEQSRTELPSTHPAGNRETYTWERRRFCQETRTNNKRTQQADQASASSTQLPLHAHGFGPSQQEQLQRREAFQWQPWRFWTRATWRRPTRKLARPERRNHAKGEFTAHGEIAGTKARRINHRRGGTLRTTSSALGRT